MLRKMPGQRRLLQRQSRKRRLNPGVDASAVSTTLIFELQVGQSTGGQSIPWSEIRRHVPLQGRAPGRKALWRCWAEPGAGGGARPRERVNKEGGSAEQASRPAAIQRSPRGRASGPALAGDSKYPETLVFHHPIQRTHRATSSPLRKLLSAHTTPGRPWSRARRLISRITSAATARGLPALMIEPGAKLI